MDPGCDELTKHLRLILLRALASLHETKRRYHPNETAISGKRCALAGSPSTGFPLAAGGPWKPAPLAFLDFRPQGFQIVLFFQRSG